ncbi:MAG: hypothetical protein K9M45_01495, partial [Kiritimatiellales bacterium]|nr:hypothetical protein [Kiritimatiellales bacterium]
PVDTIRIQRTFQTRWPTIEKALKTNTRNIDAENKYDFLKALECLPSGGSYTEMIRSLDEETRSKGRSWLQSLVDDVVGLWPETD